MLEHQFEQEIVLKGKSKAILGKQIDWTQLVDGENTLDAQLADILNDQEEGLEDSEDDYNMLPVDCKSPEKKREAKQGTDLPKKKSTEKLTSNNNQ